MYLHLSAAVALFVLSFAGSQGHLMLDEGDECPINGMKGTCKFPSSCKHVDIRSTRPPICGFSDKTPIICCKSQSLGVSSTRVSEKKCKTYSEVCKRNSLRNRTPREMTNIEDLLAKPASVNTDFHTTVVGGKDAAARKYKGMAMLGFGKNIKRVQWNCGGSLITNRHVLTAAHCAQSNNGRPKWVRVGELDYSTDNDDARPQDRNVADWISHPGFKINEMHNDIAIVVMDVAVVFTEWVEPICLHRTETIPNTIATIIGYGRLGFVEQTSTILQEVDVTLVDGEECKMLYSEDAQITKTSIVPKSQICAGEKTGGKDACRGDSGGPLLITLPGQCLRTVIGIVSHGRNCALPNVPGVYTRVSYFLDWIEKTVWPSG